MANAVDQHHSSLNTPEHSSFPIEEVQSASSKLAMDCPIAIPTKQQPTKDEDATQVDSKPRAKKQEKQKQAKSKTASQAATPDSEHASPKAKPKPQQQRIVTKAIPTNPYCGLNKFTDFERANIYASLVCAWERLGCDTGTYSKPVFEIVLEILSRRFRMTQLPTQRNVRDVHKNLLARGTTNNYERFKPWMWK